MAVRYLSNCAGFTARGRKVTPLAQYKSWYFLSLQYCRNETRSRRMYANSVPTSTTSKNNGSRESGGGSGDEKKKSFSTEWKLVGSFAVAVFSFILNAKMERSQSKKEMELGRIQNQIKDLYGPLYGNRLVSETSYRAVMKNHLGITKYLREARIKRDADMIHRWRSYFWNVLYPLDKAAVEMILKNAHLIANGDFPDEFEELLIHVAKIEFVMEHWKLDNGELEPTKSFTEDDYLEVNNASGVGRSRILSHVKERYDELRERQRSLSLQISNDKQADNALLNLLNRVIK